MFATLARSRVWTGLLRSDLLFVAVPLLSVAFALRFVVG